MINQSFSAENFEKIFNIENRKGKINKEFLPSEYIAKICEIKSKRFDAKDLKAKRESEEITKDEYRAKKDSLNEEIKKLKAEKEEILYEHLKVISKKVNDPKFKFVFEVGERNGKQTYELGNDEVQFYAIKQLQYNIRKTFKVKQSDRYKTLKQIKLILSDGLPKIIIRTDITSFYESIPQSELLHKIENDTLLTYQSKQFIISILNEFESKRENSKDNPNMGVPRGVGISAYLSELYIKDVDRKIKSITNVSFYARYVDDIFIVITPPSSIDSHDYLSDIKRIILENKLNIKEEKTGVFVIDRNSATFKRVTISYLGYQFILEHSLKAVHLRTLLSDNKIEKYKKRLSQAFDEYNIESKYNEKTARHIFFNRLRFLTGNTNLINSKSGIKVGIYYTNSLLDEDGVACDLGCKLDGFLKQMVHTNLKPHCPTSFDVERFKKYILNQFSFAEGFRNLKFHKFTNDDFRAIKNIWNE